MKYRIIFSALLSLFIVKNALASEGMWIPMLLKALNESEMIDNGFRLTAEDIYSINQSSMKDAVIHFNGGCTGEIVSSEGLLFTNHHCGYSQIQSHSTLENNYLKDGFWAMDRKSELPNKGLFVTFIVRMEDVTSQVLSGIDEKDTEDIRQLKIAGNISKIRKEATSGTHYDAIIRPFFYGNEYYMFITETFNDVRLVGAPPSAIGKFGYDKDNWMWPRHTGDFSVFRIYADKNNQPAEYSADNVPYRPRHHFPVSIRGVEDGDFSMIFGFPGRTQQYLTSYAVDYVLNKSNPAKIEMRRTSLSIIDADMNSSERIKLAYASKQSRISNSYKKWIGESRGLRQLDALEVKRKQEMEFNKLANQRNLTQYMGLLKEFEQHYQSVERYELARDFFIEYVYLGPEILRFSNRFERLVYQYEDLKSQGKLEAEIEKLKASAENYFKDYNEPTDKKLFAALTALYHANMDKELIADEFNTVIMGKYKGDFDAYTEMVFDKSVFTSKEKVLAMLNTFGNKWVKKLKKDPAFTLIESVNDSYFNKVQGERNRLQNLINERMRIYVKAKREMFPDKRYWSDANSTLRVAYGKVEGSSPRDGMSYKYISTIEGIMEKYIPGDRDYDVPDKLRELYAKKDYGPYGEDGTLPICFTASNHTTGGNSGSPAINADGHLVGINFDRSWESTMSDIMYDPDRCRNIIVDVRYVLFVIDKYGGAGHLVDEMTIIDDSWEETRRTEQLKKQVRDMTSRIKSIPQDPGMFLGRANAYLELEMLDEALADFESALKIDKNHGAATAGKAWVLSKQGKNADAKKLFDRAVKLDDDNAGIYHVRGLFYSNQSKNEDAIRNFDKAIALDAAHLKSYYERGICKHNLGKTTEGCKDIFFAERMGHEVPEKIKSTLCKK